MTKNKHLKRAIRERALETGTSYSTSRAALGVTTPPRTWPPTLETLASLPSASDEVLPTHWDWHAFPPMHSETLNFSDRKRGSVIVPQWAVAYAVVGTVDEHGAIIREPGATTTLVFCRKIRSEEHTWASLRRAERENPRLKWQHMSGLQNGYAWPGGDSPYWAFMLTYNSEGLYSVHPGKGLATLAELLRDMPPADDEAKPLN
jgi:hypothetical protein